MQARILAPATMHVVPTRAILTAAESERVRFLLRRRLATHHDNNVTALARELGLSQPQLSRTLNQAHGVSLSTARALARVEGVDVESVLNDPRTVAARICRGNVPESAIQRALEEPEGDEARPAFYWIERMKALAVLYPDPASRPSPHDSQTMPIVRAPRPSRAS
jgi:transcriptional regulator with XRE-family HTH domain